MTFRPKISVLIPTFQYARFLPAAIDSVLAQDFSDFELLIGDDASRDGSADIIRSYADRDPRIRFQIHPKNLGMVANWNWCLGETRGDHVKFLFGDDCLLSPQALGRLSAALDAEPRAILAVSARTILDQDSRTLAIWDELGDGGYHTGADIFLRCLRRDRNLIGEPSAVLFRRAAGARGFDSSFRQLVDQEMWFHLLREGGLWYDPEPLCAFRCHPAQQSAVNQPSRVASAETLRIVARYFRGFAASAGLDPNSLGMRRILFRCVYYARKNAGDAVGAAAAEAVVRQWLPDAWYRACWWLHRLTKPVRNLCRHFARPPARAGEAPTPPRILVIRRRYLGDIVLLGSFLRNLRLHWPAARIEVLAEPAFAAVLALNPDVNETVVLPRSVRAWPALLLGLRRRGYTHVFNFDNTEGTAALARLTGARFRAGLHHGGYRLKLRRSYTHAIHDPNDRHEARPITEYYLSTLEAAGVPIVTREVRLVPREKDLEEMGRFVGAAGSPVLLVHPGSRSPCRIWPAERFAAVCDRVQDELGVQTVVVGGPDERERVAEIRRLAHAHILTFSEPPSLPRLAALARLATVVLCHASGPMHVAAAIGTPVVALYGSQNAILFRPMGEHHTLLQAPMPCNDCVAPDRCVPRDSYHNYCVRRLTVDEVFAAVSAQFARRRAGVSTQRDA